MPYARWLSDLPFSGCAMLRPWYRFSAEGFGGGLRRRANASPGFSLGLGSSCERVRRPGERRSAGRRSARDGGSAAIDSAIAANDGASEVTAGEGDQPTLEPSRRWWPAASIPARF